MRFRRLRRRIVVFGVIVILAFVGSSLHDVWRSYRHTVETNEREIGNVATALAGQTSWTWQAVDLLLRETARWYREDAPEIPPERIDAILAARTAAERQVRLVTIVDANGIQRHRSRGHSPPGLDVSDRSYFIDQRDNPADGPSTTELLVTRSEGRPGVVLARRLEDADGKFAGVVTAIVDLEDLKDFYQPVDLGRSDAIQLLRDDGSLLTRDPPIADMVGGKYPALAGIPSGAVVRIVDPIDDVDSMVATAHVRGTPLVIVVTRQVKGAFSAWRGDTFGLVARAVLIALLGVLILVALLRQLRRIELGESALRESEERYALAMEGANEGHWDWNMRSDHLFLSPRMKTLFGMPVGESRMTRADWNHAVDMHPDDRSRFEAAISDHFEGRSERYVCEYRVRHPDGEWRWINARGRSLRDAAGRPFRFVGSAADITAAKQAEQEKERLEAQLRQSQKMEAIGTLAGGIAHDFNNILGAIIGYGELAQQRSEQGSAVRRYVDHVMQAAGRAKLLVDRILGFSRSGLGERVPVHVRDIAIETLELLEASTRPGIRIESRLSAHGVAVIGDATQLHQVAMNLCTNALQAMPDGGVLSVEFDAIDLAETQVLSRGSIAAGRWVRLAVGDTGTGIPAAVVERMFDPFFTTKGVGDGTGLGLSLVHGIVSDLGGTIDVATREGRGTTFSIWLPRASETASADADDPVEIRHGNGECVLVVDDETALVELAEEMLADLGYEPVGFDSSVAALEAFRATPDRFDLVLSDEVMPDLVGTELAGRIREIDADIPIVLMSGNGGTQFAMRIAALGIDGVLRKPLRSRDLAEALAHALAR